jgi:hypothetical protein
LILNDSTCLPLSCDQPNVSFSGTDGVLDITNSATLSNLTEGEQIYKFAPGDTIDFEGVGGAASSQIGKIYSNGETEFIVYTTKGFEEFYLNGNLTGNNFSIKSDSSGGFVFSEGTPCFLKGTKILTENGEIYVEKLSVGDWVITFFGDIKKIKFIGKRRLKSNPKVSPIRFPAGCLADGVPTSDLWLSPDHALCFSDVLVEAKNLIDAAMIFQDHSIQDVEYFHIELEEHDILIANGTPAESFLDCGHRGFFENSDEPMILHPDLMQDFRRDKSVFQIAVPGDDSLKMIRESLQERAFRFGYELQEPRRVALVLSDSTIIVPIRSNDELIFNLPENVSESWLTSASFVPAEIDAASNDRRHLGIAISEMKINGLPVSLADIVDDGIYLGENDPSAWTNGNAHMNFPDGTRKVSLKVVGYPTVWQLPKFKKFG